jgi:hypothetical protein
MSKYTSFQMSLNPLIQIEPEDGSPVYVVRVHGLGVDPVHCSGRSVRSAFEQATCYIESLISHMCEECATQVEGYDEAFRNSGVCQNCHDQNAHERNPEWGMIDL